MTALNRLRLEFACEAFLAAMRKEFARRNPNQEAPMRALADYSPADRSVLMNAVGAVAVSMSEVRDDAFDDWKRRREEEFIERP